MDVYSPDTQNTSSSCSSSKHIFGAVGFLLLGLILGMFLDPYLPAVLSNTQKGYASGFAAAQSRIQESTFGKAFQTSADVRLVSGVVTANDGSKLTIKAKVSPFEDPSLAVRTLDLTASTSVLSMVNLGFPTASATTTKVAATPFKFKVVKVSDIKVGDTIVAVATTNISTLKEFPVTAIQIVTATN